MNTYCARLSECIGERPYGAYVDVCGICAVIHLNALDSPNSPVPFHLPGAGRYCKGDKMAYNKLAAIGEYTFKNTTNYTSNNKCVLMTLDNILMFCDNINITNYQGGADILTLPDSFPKPTDILYFPVSVYDNNASSSAFRLCSIRPTGTLRLHTSYTNATIRINCICIHLNSIFYTPAIGNIYDNGSSPLNA